MTKTTIGLLIGLVVNTAAADTVVNGGMGGAFNNKTNHAGDGGVITLGHRWGNVVQQTPAMTKGQTSNGGAYQFSSASAPVHLEPLSSSPKWSAIFKLADGRPLIEMKANCDVLIFDSLVDRDCKPLMAFGAWLASFNRAAVYADGKLIRSGVNMLPGPGAYFSGSPGKGGGENAHDGDIRFLAADFSMVFSHNGSVKITKKDTSSTVLRQPEFGWVVYEAFRHWLALSTANPAIELHDGKAALKE